MTYVQIKEICMQENAFNISMSDGKKRTSKTERSKHGIKKHRPHPIKGRGQKEAVSIYDRIWALLDIEIDTSLKY